MSAIPVAISNDFTKEDPAVHGEHAPLVQAMQATVDKRVEQFVTVRDKVRAMKERHEAELKPLLEVQNLLQGWLEAFMTNSGSTGVKTAHGTCYKSTRYTASLADPDAFMGYVIKTGKYELLDRRANATAVKDYVKENAGNLPPGVNLSAISTVGVRRPGKNEAD
jgi:hypothetical protein